MSLYKSSLIESIKIRLYAQFYSLLLPRQVNSYEFTSLPASLTTMGKLIKVVEDEGFIRATINLNENVRETIDLTFNFNT